MLPTKTLIQIVWGLDGKVGANNTDLTATCSKIADFVGIQREDLKASLLRSLWEESDVRRETGDFSGGVVDIDDAKVIWWNDNAETRWMRHEDCDDDAILVAVGDLPALVEVSSMMSTSDIMDAIDIWIDANNIDRPWDVVDDDLAIAIEILHERHHDDWLRSRQLILEEVDT